MIICFDLETTGLDKYNDKIIELAMLKFDRSSFKVIERYSCLINPEIDIPETISNITNIFNSDLKGAPKIEEIREEIIDFIGDSPLLGHNVEFDIGFFLSNGIDVSNNIKIDTFFLANFLSQNSDSLNLEMLCRHYGIEFSGAHRAINDAEATIKLFKKQIELFGSLENERKQLIHYIFSLSNDKNIKYIEDLFFPLFTDIVDFSSFEKILLKKIGKKKHSEEFFFKPDLEFDDFGKTFTFGGKMEKRQNQLNMAEKVFDTIKNKKKSLIEAPTGLGKSFAYLIPSIIHSVKNNEKIYISTKTKTLQDQLFYKDLKFLGESLGINFSYSKLKGKRNYISLKGFFDYILLGDIEYERISFLIKISLWLLETKHGELDELNFFPFEYSYLRDLSVVGEDNTKEKNLYYQYEFLLKARDALTNSNITVINHSLLFSSIESENISLPSFKNLILDEAHNIEESVTDALRESYNFLFFKEYIEKTEKIMKKKKIGTKDFMVIKENLLSLLIVLDDYSISYLNEKIGENVAYKTLLIKEDFFKEWDYTNYIEKIKQENLSLVKLLKNQEKYDFSREINFFEGMISVLTEFFKEDNKDLLIKILNSNDRGLLTYSHTLLSPGIFLENKLWNKLDSCILTSATLKIGDSFDYFKKIFNLREFDFSSFDSDFDYEKQATLFIPTDVGNIKNNNEEIGDFLKNFYLRVGGNTLTLFTNFSTIRYVYNACFQELKKEGINLYAQSIGGSKVKLISSFKANPDKSILLGTDSFWEGIDIPGEDLKYLIIHKFPFQVPTDPIFQARTVFFKDSFMEYSVPKAIIKLKQGLGRLIRTKDDKGVIVLLDNRINTEWGKAFYEAFPKDIKIKKGTKRQFLDVLEG